MLSHRNATQATSLEGTSQHIYQALSLLPALQGLTSARNSVEEIPVFVSILQPFYRRMRHREKLLAQVYTGCSESQHLNRRSDYKVCALSHYTTAACKYMTSRT